MLRIQCIYTLTSVFKEVLTILARSGVFGTRLLWAEMAGDINHLRPAGESRPWWRILRRPSCLEEGLAGVREPILSKETASVLDRGGSLLTLPSPDSMRDISSVCTSRGSCMIRSITQWLLASSSTKKQRRSTNTWTVRQTVNEF